MRRLMILPLFAIFIVGSAWAAPASHHPARSKHHSVHHQTDAPLTAIYPLELEDGTPVLKDYPLAGTHLKPNIDTGSPGGAVIPTKAYKKLHGSNEFDFG